MIEYNVITSWEVIMQRPAFTEGEFSWPDVQCEAIRIEDKFRMKSETGYKRVIVKIGSSSLTHEETGKLELGQIIVEWMCVWSALVQSPLGDRRWAFMRDRRISR